MLDVVKRDENNSPSIEPMLDAKLSISNKETCKNSTDESECTIPERFLKAANNDPDAAKSLYEENMQWRQQEQMDSVFSMPHPHFTLIKEHFPHFIHLRGKQNEVVYYESPAKIDLEALKAGGVTMEILLHHYMIVTEFLWGHVDTSESAKCIYVMDLEGARLMDFVGDVVQFIKQASNLCNKYYPGRVGHIIIVNAPYWFNVAWTCVQGFVSEETLNQVQVVRWQSEITQTLKKYIDEENIPPKYGGVSMSLGSSPEEKEFSETMTCNNHKIENDDTSSDGSYDNYD